MKTGRVTTLHLQSKLWELYLHRTETKRILGSRFLWLQAQAHRDSHQNRTAGFRVLRAHGQVVAVFRWQHLSFEVCLQGWLPKLSLYSTKRLPLLWPLVYRLVER